MKSHAPSCGPGTPAMHPALWGRTIGGAAPWRNRCADHPGVRGRTQPADRPIARQMEDGSTHREGSWDCGTRRPGCSCRSFRAPESRRVRRSGRPTPRRPGRCAGRCGQAAGGQPAPADAKHTAPTLPCDTALWSCRPSRTARRRACQILTGASTGVKPAKRRRSSASMATLVIWSELCVSPLAYGRGGWCPGSRLLRPSCWRSLQHGGGRGTARPGLAAR